LDDLEFIIDDLDLCD